MNIKPIRTQKDYDSMFKRFDHLMSFEKLSKEEQDELEILSTLLDVYESKKITIEDPSPIEAIRFRMEQMDLTRHDLESLLQCHRGRVSEILNQKRPLSLSMIRSLKKGLGISGDILTQEYPLHS